MFKDKKIYSCHNCGKKVRIPTRKNIVFNCPKCNRRIHYYGKRGFYLSCLAVVLVISLIAYQSYFKEYFDFQRVKRLKTQSECVNYLNAYPNGRFKEEVKFIEVKAVRNISLIRSFLDDFPTSEKKSEVLKMNEELWANELQRYDETIKSKIGLDSSAVIFFKDLLLYMRDHNLSDIKLDLRGNVNVRNFNQYSKKVQNELDAIMTVADGRTVTNHIVKIKDKYAKGYINFYEKIIMNAIEGGFENILSKNFINIVNESHDKTPLVVKINYNIKNQERPYFEKDIFPVLWSYMTGEGRNGDNKIFVTYLIGVSIDYSFDMTLPNGGRSLQFQNKTNALDNIRNINSIEEGYERMTAQNFNNYATEVLKKFGLFEQPKENED